MCPQMIALNTREKGMVMLRYVTFFVLMVACCVAFQQTSFRSNRALSSGSRLHGGE